MRNRKVKTVNVYYITVVIPFDFNNTSNVMNLQLDVVVYLNDLE